MKGLFSTLSFVTFIVMGVASCPRPSSVPTGCAKDSDCKGQRVCEAKRCVDLADADETKTVRDSKQPK